MALTFVVTHIISKAFAEFCELFVRLNCRVNAMAYEGVEGHDALMLGRTTNFVIRLNKGCKILSFYTRLLKSGESFVSFVFALCDAESRAISIVMECESGQKYSIWKIFCFQNTHTDTWNTRLKRVFCIGK
jgi:hypothetical protein